MREEARLVSLRVVMLELCVLLVGTFALPSGRE